MIKYPEKVWANERGTKQWRYYKIWLSRNFGLFHMEGDDAVLEDVTVYLKNRGVIENAQSILFQDK